MVAIPSAARLASLGVGALYVAAMVVNVVSNTGSVPVSNVQLSSTHPVYLLPSGYAFAIWSIIYLLLGAVVVVQALPSNVDDPSTPGAALYAKLRPWLALALATNGAWLYLFSFQLFWAAFVDIAVYLGALVAMVRIVDLDLAADIGQPEYKQRLLVHAACASNAAWVSVATCLQLQINLMEEGYYPSADLSVGLVVLIGGVAALRCFAKADLVWALVSAWALAAIVHNQRPASKWGCVGDVCAACAAAPQRICASERAAPLGWAKTCAGGAAAKAVAAGELGACVVPKSEALSAACEVVIALVAASFVLGVVRGLLAKRARAGNKADEAE